MDTGSLEPRGHEMRGTSQELDKRKSSPNFAGDVIRLLFGRAVNMPDVVGSYPRMNWLILPLFPFPDLLPLAHCCVLFCVVRGDIARDKRLLS